MKSSDIENGVEVCRLIELITRGDPDVCVDVYSTDENDSECIAFDGLFHFGSTLIECLVKAAINDRLLVICGDFIGSELFWDMTDAFRESPLVARASCTWDGITSEDKPLF